MLVIRVFRSTSERIFPVSLLLQPSLYQTPTSILASTRLLPHSYADFYPGIGLTSSRQWRRHPTKPQLECPAARLQSASSSFELWIWRSVSTLSSGVSISIQLNIPHVNLQFIITMTYESNQLIFQVRCNVLNVKCMWVLYEKTGDF